jgi:ribonuclease-3
MSSDLQKNIGYEFRDVTLLDMALTHASVQKKTYDNERLEFLGDRVLGLVLADILYRANPSEKEGALARRHGALVQQSSLVAVAKNLDLGSVVRAAGNSRENAALLADAAEALIGAIYLDGGYAAAEKFIVVQWEKMLQDQQQPPEDPKTALQEWAQERGLPLPEYKVVAKSGSDHEPVFTIEVSVKDHDATSATAANKRLAEKEAAGKMLEQVRSAK